MNQINKITHKKPFIIAVSSISGGGKTTIVNELAKKLANTKILYFDNYEGDLLHQDYCEWSEKGADYNEWKLEPIIHDINLLREEKPDYILLDYPFGYGNNEVGKYIDYTVFIDTPLDIALARRISRDFIHRDPSRRKLDNPLQCIDETLTFYIKRHRNTYLTHIKTVMPHSDFVVDGALPLNTIVDLILQHLTDD